MFSRRQRNPPTMQEYLVLQEYLGEAMLRAKNLQEYLVEARLRAKILTDKKTGLLESNIASRNLILRIYSSIG